MSPKKTNISRERQLNFEKAKSEGVRNNIKDNHSPIQQCHISHSDRQFK